MIVELTRSSIQPLLSVLDSRMKSFKYQYVVNDEKGRLIRLSEIAGRNWEFPPVITILTNFLNDGYIPVEDELINKVLECPIKVPSSISKDMFIKCRCHSFYSSFLRELHFAFSVLQLAPLSRITKNDILDMNEGVDFIYYPNEPKSLVEVKVNIGHEGNQSQWHYINRKFNKQNGVIKLIASSQDGGNSIHVIKHKNIKAFLNEFGY